MKNDYWYLRDKFMECLYSPLLQMDSHIIKLSHEESKHAKVLRLREADPILISSGNGFLAKGRVHAINQGIYEVLIEECRKHAHELSFRLGIALPLLSSKERMEFAIEKLTELGISDIHLFISDRVQTHTCDVDRLQTKALSAMKQSKRSILPIIHPIIPFDDLSDIAMKYSAIIMGDVKGNTSFPKMVPTEYGLLVCIGPEGGFSDQEMSTLRSISHVFPIRLGHSRLRAETAAIALTALSSFHGE